jgi:ADP-ribose pyrophosphatase YjhB (NUDIX family)
MLPAEQLALWADRLRDMAVLGLLFARSEADLARYETIAGVSLTLWAAATGRSPAALAARRDVLFALPTPHVRAQAVLLDGEAVWLVGGEQDGWQLPGDLYRLPDDSPAGGLLRIVAAQTGLLGTIIALTGVYDSPPQAQRQAYHAYDYVFAMQSAGGAPVGGARRFPLADLPPLPADERQRLDHALAVARGGAAPYFDFSGGAL